MRPTLCLSALAALLLLAALPAGAAPTLGQVDTFVSNTTEDWFAGGGPFGQQPPIPPVVVAGGGPGGAGDAFLSVTGLGGSGNGSRLVVMNASQWAGNYLAAGIGGISMDLRNLGTSDLSIRLLLETVAGNPVNTAVTTDAVLLPAGGGWTTVQFALDPGALTVLLGTANALLADVSLLRIIHATGPTPAQPIAGQLGVDNITALGPNGTAVPEPGALLLLGTALLLLGAATRLARAR